MRVNVTEYADQPMGAEPPGSSLDLVELLFFAYRDFVADADRILATYGLGRAHHRVIHFVARRPGMRVADLLDVLRITKQSLNRVLKDLVGGGLIEQRTGASDRRQRLLFTTTPGLDLASRLATVQAARIEAAVADDPALRAAATEFLLRMVDRPERERVRRASLGARMPP